MPRLEELTRGALVKGIRPDGPVTVLDVPRGVLDDLPGAAEPPDAAPATRQE
jgi:hypothetical protein